MNGTGYSRCGSPKAEVIFQIFIVDLPSFLIQEIPGAPFNEWIISNPSRDM